MKKLTLLLILLLKIATLNSQLYQSKNGSGVPTDGLYRVITIMINIIYDQTPTRNPIDESIQHAWMPGIPNSINNSIPSYLSDFYDSEYDPNNTHGITRALHESSFGKLVVLSDYIIVNIAQSRITPTNPGGDFYSNDLINSVMEILDSTGIKTVFGHDSLADYDIFTNNILWGQPSIFAPDSSVDYVQFLFRNSVCNTSYCYGEYNSGAGVGGVSLDSLKFGNKKVRFDNGNIQMIGAGYFNKVINSILRHEFCHSLFGPNSFHSGGGSHYANNYVTTFMGIQGGYGLMGGGGTTLVSCNGYDRWRMGWKRDQNDSLIMANNVYSDLKKADGNKTLYLRDFVTYGDVIRIKLPYKESNLVSNQYIWLEFHNIGNNAKLDFLDNFDFITSCRPSGAPGIYAYIQVGKDILASTNSDTIFQEYETDNLKFFSAEGNYDYGLIGKGTDCVFYDTMRDIQTCIRANPFLGYNDYGTHIFNSYSDTIRLKRVDDKLTGVKEYNGMQNSALPYLGDNNDAFTGNSVIGIGSNPPTTNAVTFYAMQDDGIIIVLPILRPRELFL